MTQPTTQRTTSLYVFATIILATLKLAGAINWSWWWVFAPMWIPFLVILGILMIGVVVVAIYNIIKIMLDKTKRDLL